MTNDRDAVSPDIRRDAGPGMTREGAQRLLRSLAGGLPSNLEGERRLLERIAVRHDAEELRDALTERGARAVLEGGDTA
jgi:hypothetical protein